MNRIFVFILLTASTISLVQAGSTEEEEYAAVLTTVSAMNLSVSVLRNSSGDWITLFSAEKGVENESNGLNLGIKHTVFKSGQKNIVRVTGVIRDVHSENVVNVVVPEQGGQEENVSGCNETAMIDRSEEHRGVLRFHEKTGKYIALINDRKTAYRKDPYHRYSYAGLYTNRPLMDGEIFQVQLDKRLNQWITYALYIGVTLQEPYNIGNKELLSHAKNGTWYAGFNSVTLDESTINGSYPFNPKNLPLGTRIGVMRKKNRDLHFFLNGVDHGVAAKYVPGPVYGILDLAYYGTQVSIVD